MTKYINPNILDEGNWMEILKDNEDENEDEMERIVRCNNCGQLTKYGMTRMCNGFVGCDNKIEINGKEVECYFGDLMPRVREYKYSGNPYKYNLYKTGKLYRWRDNCNE